MKKKQIILTLTGCLLMIGVSFGATYAYLTAKDFKVNEFKTAENTIKIEEDFEPPDKLDPQEQTDIKKIVNVQNTGTVPCFVRVRVEFSDSRAQDFCEPIAFNINGDTKWTKWDPDDGYFYYTGVLSPNELTNDPLFEKIVLKKNKEDGSLYTDEDMIDFDVYVYAESCEQIKNDETYAEAWKRVRDAEEQGGAMQ